MYVIVFVGYIHSQAKFPYYFTMRSSGCVSVIEVSSF
jgi:hypothetical protein